MIFFSLLAVFAFFLKKYLDHQGTPRNPVQHYVPREEAGEYGSEDYDDRYSSNHYDLLVRCLIFCSYDAVTFKEVDECLSLRDIGDDLKSLYDEKKMESLFRNQWIDRSLHPQLLHFKAITSEITEFEWLSESVDLVHDERWRIINTFAEKLLTKMNVKERGFDFALYRPR